MQKITPFLWFDTNAEEAVNFYVSVFKDSEIVNIVRYGDAGPGPSGSAMTVAFKLQGQEFTALNGGPHFSFTPAISFVVHCEDQLEVDEVWDKLVEGGEPVQCGWLRDKFGLSWQIIPKGMIEMLSSDDAGKSGRAMEAMLTMTKIDLRVMKEAFDG